MESSLYFRLGKLKKGFLIISFAFVVSMSDGVRLERPFLIQLQRADGVVQGKSTVEPAMTSSD
jgi:hypothetical protein